MKRFLVPSRAGVFLPLPAMKPASLVAQMISLRPALILALADTRPKISRIKPRIHANEKHCVHDFKMALLVIRKANKTAHRSKDSFSSEERRNLRLILGDLARPTTTANRHRHQCSPSLATLANAPRALDHQQSAGGIRLHPCSQMPIGIDDQRGHGGNWRRLVDGDALLLQITQSASSKRTSPKHEQTRQWWQPPGQRSSMKVRWTGTFPNA